MDLAQSIIVSTLMLGLGFLPPHAQEALSAIGDDNQKQEILLFKVRVIDPDGYPVENAKVLPVGLRTTLEPASHRGWNRKQYGPDGTPITNADGEVEISYPKNVGENFEVGTITISVTHPDFVTFRADFRTGQQPAEAKLQHGFRIAATAVDSASGERISSDLYGLVSGESRMAEWKLTENGTLLSPAFESGKIWLRLIRIRSGEPNLFSQLIEVNSRDQSRIMLRDIKLSKGTRVTGRLDESVARPIKNGRVAAMIVRPANGNQRGDWKSTWTWFEHTALLDDGTFVFESLPSNEILQLIPTCDDWVPKSPTQAEVLPHFKAEAEEMSEYFTYPQVVRIKGAQTDSVLHMTPATSVRVTVLDNASQPIPGARVVSSPNQYWFESGSQILGEAFSMSDALVKSREAGEYNWECKNIYAANTDESGVAILASMPTGRFVPIAASKMGYKMESDRPGIGTMVHLKEEQETEVTITLLPVGN
ncbi:hypothetical protein SH449x_000509 [Pirellulaceae bacterium SH449]